MMSYKFAGYTLIELLVTLLVLIIALSFGLGLNRHFVEKNKVDRLSQQLITALQFSRNQAMSRAEDLTLNPLNDSGDWSSGMVLFIDNQAHRYLPQDQAVYTWSWTRTPGLKLLWHGFESKQYLTFSKSLRQSTVNGQFVILKSGIEVRHIILNRLGRVVSDD